MERHVSLLGILASLWGALAAIIGVAMLLLAAGALAELLAPLEASVSFAAGLAAVGFALFGVFALVFGAAHIWAAALLRGHKPVGRILMLALAIGNLLVIPFGTALGVYALWVLLTNEPCRSAQDALRVAGWYAKRPIVEEYHKAMKTGCGIELPQLTDKSRLEPVIAMISVVAVFLLGLRDAARDERKAQEPAENFVPTTYVKVINACTRCLRSGKVTKAVRGRKSVGAL